jgi:hypothetical protein
MPIVRLGSTRAIELIRMKVGSRRQRGNPHKVCFLPILLKTLGHRFVKPRCQLMKSLLHAAPADGTSRIDAFCPVSLCSFDGTAGHPLCELLARSDVHGVVDPRPDARFTRLPAKSHKAGRIAREKVR